MPEAELLTSLGEVAGIGGIAIGLVLLIFRAVTGSALKVKTERGYRLLRLALILTWSIGLAGVGVYGLGFFVGPRDGGDTITTKGDRSPVVKDTEGDVTITIGDEPRKD